MNQRALSKHSESTQSTQRALREYLKSTQRILKEHSKSNQRERDQSDFVIPSEPKILRLVVSIFDASVKVIELKYKP